MKSLWMGCILTVGLVLTSGCTGGKVVATVGSQKITQGDVNFRLDLMKAASPSFSEKAALEQLIRTATLSEILKSKGIELTEKAIDEEFDRIKKTASNNPQMAKVFDEFGSKKKFKTLYIQPMLIDRLAFTAGYQKDDAFHQEMNDKMQSILKEAKANPSKLQEMAQKMGLSYRRGSIQEKDGSLSWESDRNVASPMNLPQGAGLGQRWKKSVFEKMSSGKIAENFENLGPFMMVMRLDSKDKNGMKFSAAFATKKSFGDWFNAHKASVQVTRMEEPKSNDVPAPKPE